MIALAGIQNFLLFVNANWVSICVVIGLALSLYKKVKDYLSKSQEEKIEIAKTQVQDVLLSLVSEAELDYDGWNKAGAAKRSQVVKELYQMLPILGKVTKQEEFTQWLDKQIDNSLAVLAESIVNK